MSHIDGSDQTDVWQVQLPTGEVRSGTLEQLDAAFEAGAITADTMVLGPGQAAWARLGEVAGLDEPEAAPAASVAPPSLPASAMPNTMRPVVSEVGDFDLDAVSLQGPKKRGLVIAIAAVVLLGGSAVAMTSGSGPAAPAAAAANTQASPPPAPPPPPPKLVETAPSSPAPAATLTDAQRKALLDADKARDAKRKAKEQAGSSSSSRRSSTSSTPFNNSGNPNDPLNNKL